MVARESEAHQVMLRSRRERENVWCWWERGWKPAKKGGQATDATADLVILQLPSDDSERVVRDMLVDVDA